MALKKFYSRIFPFRGEKKSSFCLFLVKKPQRTNKPESKTNQTKNPHHQHITKAQNPTTKPKQQKPNTSQYNSSMDPWKILSQKKNSHIQIQF